MHTSDSMYRSRLLKTEKEVKEDQPSPANPQQNMTRNQRKNFRREAAKPSPP